MKYAIINTENEIVSIDSMPHPTHVSIEVEDDFTPSDKKFDSESNSFKRDIDAVKKEAHAKIKSWYVNIKEKGIQGGIYSDILARQIDCNADSIVVAERMVTAGKINSKFAPTFYKCFDNTIVDCTYEQWVGVYSELHLAGLNIWNKQNQEKEALKNAKTVEEIEAIMSEFTGE